MPDIAAQCAALAATHMPLPKPELAAVLALSYSATPATALLVMEKSAPAVVQSSPKDVEFVQEFGRQVSEACVQLDMIAKPISWADIVFEKDGVPMASSRKVAEVFEKRHNNVLRDIDRLIETGYSELSSLFTEGAAYNDKARKDVRFFLMTRDGFSLLAMGFTGKRALEFKLGFIRTFNAMETELKERLAKDHRDRLARTTQLLVDTEQQRDAVTTRLTSVQKLSSGLPLTKSRRLPLTLGTTKTSCPAARPVRPALAHATGLRERHVAMPRLRPSECFEGAHPDFYPE